MEVDDALDAVRAAKENHRMIYELRIKTFVR